jgi:hypothetical protein
MLGELLGHFKTKAEKKTVSGDAYLQQRYADAARIVEEFGNLQQQVLDGESIDENGYWTLRDRTWGSPNRLSLLEEIGEAEDKRNS